MRGLYIFLGIIGALLIFLILNHDQGSLLGIQNDKFASAAFMGIWATLIGAAIIPRTGGLGAAARNAIIWIAIILVLMAGYVYRFDLQDIGSRMTAGLIPGSPVSSQSSNGRDQIMLIRSNNGHFEARATVNGQDILFLIDTGASSIVLSHRDAEAVGIDTNSLSYSVPVMTANGSTTSARATLNTIDIGEIRRSKIGILVAQDGNLETSLLGMNFLKTLWGFEIRGDRLILTD
ncbi:MAG: TIGR02281 family clan AA aspartic protease [Salaquimonas sp.]